MFSRYIDLHPYFRLRKTQWDFVLQEGVWLARDFYYERKWKVRSFLQFFFPEALLLSSTDVSISCENTNISSLFYRLTWLDACLTKYEYFCAKKKLVTFGALARVVILLARLYSFFL